MKVQKGQGKEKNGVNDEYMKAIRTLQEAW
jgi:hypothetical protein